VQTVYCMQLTSGILRPQHNKSSKQSRYLDMKLYGWYVPISNNIIRYSGYFYLRGSFGRPVHVRKLKRLYFTYSVSTRRAYQVTWKSVNWFKHLLRGGMHTGRWCYYRNFKFKKKSRLKWYETIRAPL
jgi:hypothetical protein